VLIRHAKSSWDDPALADFDRPLNGRGKRDAPEMGRRLAERGVDPDALLTSPARRARKTARQIAAALDFPQRDILEEEEIYEASLPALISVVHGLDDQWGEVILVGHNPGCTELANYLSDLRIENIPTCGVAAIDFEQESWSRVGERSGRVHFYDYPKKAAERDP
jgi:phosphohistidine phosphatase